MSRRGKPRIWTATVVATLVMLVSACGDGEPTPASYFEALESQTRSYAEALAELRTTFGEELAAELSVLHDRTDFADTNAVAGYFGQAKEAAIVKTADLFSREGAELRTFMDGLRELEPPDGLAQAHDDFVAGGDGLLEAMPPTIEAVRNLEVIEDLPTALEDTPYTVASQRFGIACQSLGTTAAEQGIEVELECPGTAGDVVEGDG